MMKNSTASKTYSSIMAGFLLVLLCMTIHKIAMRPPSFDGAMNLQVAYSLSEGDGVQRTYGSRDPFPSEIQTHAPFTIVSAAAYKAFGMGILQSELANMLYLGLLLCTAFFLIKRASNSTALGVTAATLILCTPGIIKFGSGGYGEIPALFWTVSSLIFLKERSSRKCVIAAGIFIGLGLATKTATIIASAVFLAGFSFVILMDRELTMRKRLRSIGILAAGFIAPLSAIEIWRFISLDGARNYFEWWTEQLTSIGMQAGTRSGFSDTQGILAKASTHIKFLASMFSLPMWLLACWILLPALLGATALWRSQDKKVSAEFCMITMAALLYFVWWIAITPTQKAWHRRIIDGALLLNLSWAYLLALVMQTRKGRENVRQTSLLTWISAGFLAAIFANFAYVKVNTIKSSRGDTKDLLSAVDALKALPRESRIYGIGWSSAPLASLLSERKFLDINDVPIGLIDSRLKSFIVVDSATPPEVYKTGVLATYTSRAILPDGKIPQIFSIDFSQPKPFINDMPVAPSSFYLKDVDQESIRGLSGVENGGRWMTSDAFVLIAAEPEARQLIIDLYMVPLSRYTSPAPRIFASLDGCMLSSTQPLQEGDNTITFSIPSTCQVHSPKASTLRIYSNSLIMSPITKDDRPLFSVLKRIQMQPGGS